MVRLTFQLPLPLNVFLDDFHCECEGEDHLPCVCRSYLFFSGWNSVVGVVPRGLDGLGIRSHWQDYGHMSSPLLGLNHPPVQWVSGFFLGVQGPGRGIDHPPYLSPMLKKKWTYTSTFPLGLHGLFQGELTFLSQFFSFLCVYCFRCLFLCGLWMSEILTPALSIISL